MRAQLFSTVILALAIAALAVFNLFLEGQVHALSQPLPAATIERPAAIPMPTTLDVAQDPDDDRTGEPSV